MYQGSHPSAAPTTLAWAAPVPAALLVALVDRREEEEPHWALLKRQAPRSPTAAAAEEPNEARRLPSLERQAPQALPFPPTLP
ncbi:MAG: hypothetical protein NTZ05_21130 [Chloroflexi bacterium]|nr:hypothetical protein [Chloroflexota bacterium]